MKSERGKKIKTEDLLIISVDEKGIIMRQEDLRAETKKKAKADKGKKLKHRLKPGEKRNRKRMATVATVYEIEARVRTPSVIVDFSEENQKKVLQKKEKTVKAKNKRV